MPNVREAHMSGYLWEPPKIHEVWWAKLSGWLLAQRLFYKYKARQRWNQMRRYVQSRTRRR